jgi:hypothetical protein
VSIHIPTDPGKSFAEPEEKTPELIERLIAKSDKVIVKKLANNDRNWAVWDEAKGRYKSNQAGVLLPAAAREVDFFPPLVPDPAKPHNSSSDIVVFWPATGKIYESRFIWYSEKGLAENHWTKSPRSEFSDLSPASFVLLFKSKESGGCYDALTVDSSDDLLCDYLDELFGASAPDFSFGIFKAAEVVLAPSRTKLQQLAADLISALLKGPAALDIFVESIQKRSTADIAAEAFEQWRVDSGNLTLNPYLLSAPGDTLQDLTREREFGIYKRDEAAHYGPRLVQAVYGSGRGRSTNEVVATLLENFDAIYRVFLSAGQTRKSRAGGSFEIHVGRMLKDGNVPHSSQPIFDRRRPDFVLPSKKIYRDVLRRSNSALVLTLKTTLRERWAQVVSESAGCPIYLGTLDERVPRSTLDKLGEAGITLVVPERFISSEFAEYQQHASVISFRRFFDDVRDTKGEDWHSLGIPCFH